MSLYHHAMGLTIHYELRLPAGELESTVRERLSALRDVALRLPFAGVSELVELSETDLNRPWPMRGLAFPRLEDVVDVASRSERDELYRSHAGLADSEWSRLNVPVTFPVLAIGFAVAPGPGSEPAALGLETVRPAGTTRWSWHSWCKTQYASNHGDEHFLRCHGSVIALLDAAMELGFDVSVHDETGYWESRDSAQLLARVAEMNRLIARFAGAFVDKAREAGADSRQVEGAIFEHPDFERLETDE